MPETRANRASENEHENKSRERRATVMMSGASSSLFLQQQTCEGLHVVQRCGYFDDAQALSPGYPQPDWRHHSVLRPTRSVNWCIRAVRTYFELMLICFVRLSMDNLPYGFGASLLVLNTLRNARFANQLDHRSSAGKPSQPYQPLHPSAQGGLERGLVCECLVHGASLQS